VAVFSCGRSPSSGPRSSAIQRAGRIVADGSAAAVAFRDDRAAGETLAALRLRPRITLGCIYATDGRLFATYRRDDTNRCPAMPPQDGAFGWGMLETIAPVTLTGQRHGTLYVARELSDVRDRLLVGAMAIGALLVVAVLTAALAASRITDRSCTPFRSSRTPRASCRPARLLAASQARIRRRDRNGHRHVQRDDRENHRCARARA
jgi:hypothetical protein